MDVISLFAAGIDNAVASLGTALTQQQARLMKRYVERVYISYDGDAAGQNATLRGLDILAAEGIDVKVITIPGGMDPDDYVKKFGKQGFLQLRDSALSANGFMLESMAKEFDLKTTDGREAFAKKACRFVGGLQPVEQERYAPVIARKTGLSEDVVKAQCGLSASGIENMPAKNRNTMSKVRQKAEDGWDTAELTILSLMLIDASTAAYTAELMAENGIELKNEAIRAAAETLLIKYAEDSAANTAIIISEMPMEQAEAVGAAQTAVERMGGDAKKIAEDCVNKLLKEKLSEQYSLMFVKAQALSGEEQRQCLIKADEIAKKLRLLR